MKSFIAERKLLFSLKDSNVLNEVSIRIGMPYNVEQNMVDFPIGDGVAGCHVEIDGLDEQYPEVYGADTMQAVNIASDIEPFLKRLSKKYNFYWSSGTPYFE